MQLRNAKFVLFELCQQLETTKDSSSDIEGSTDYHVTKVYVELDPDLDLFDALVNYV